MNRAYMIATSDMKVTDGLASDLWLHDLPANPDHWRVEALVASGEYCEMLASMLEQIACALPANCLEQYQVQDAVGQLLYIQHHYKLVRKNARQWRPNQSD